MKSNINIYQNNFNNDFKGFFNTFIELYILKCTILSKPDFYNHYINKQIRTRYIKEKYNKLIYLNENYNNKDITLLLNILFEENMIALEYLHTIIDSELFYNLLEKIIVLNENLFEFLHIRNNDGYSEETEYNINLQLKNIKKLNLLKIS